MPDSAVDGNGVYDYASGRSGRYRAGEEWGECERCGFVYPKSQLVTEPSTNRLVCTRGAKCLDPEPADNDSMAHVNFYYEPRKYK